MNSNIYGTPDKAIMREVYALAVEKMNAGEGGPFGAVVVKNGSIISRGWNRVTSANDPTAHAEIVAIREACKVLNTFDLSGCEIYASCEPCPMCLGAIYWAKLDRLSYGASREDAANAGFADKHIYDELPQKPEDRKLPSEVVLPDEGKAVFDRWLEKEDRIQY